MTVFEIRLNDNFFMLSKVSESFEKMDTEGCSFSLTYGLIILVLQFKGICLLLLCVEVQKKSQI